MIKMVSSERTASTGSQRQIRRYLRAASAVATLVVVAATAMLVSAASASAAAATQIAAAAKNDGRDISDTILGAVVVLAILVGLFLVIRRLRR
jgi:hypothetical protein